MKITGYSSNSTKILVGIFANSHIIKSDKKPKMLPVSLVSLDLALCIQS